MPADYRQGVVSIIELMRASGYLERYEDVTEEAILACIQRNPSLIDFWVLHSADKRSSSGHYLLRPGEPPDRRQGWVVGYYPHGEVIEFPDAASACAGFIKAEAEELRQRIRPC